MTFLMIVFGVLYVLIPGGIFLASLLNRDDFTGNEEKISLDELTVIVPFRNEERNIQRFLKALGEQSKLPACIIFTDDHSTDNTSRIIKEANLSTDVAIIPLPGGIEGKKQAIRIALDTVETEYVLTMDADIYFSSDYFKSVESLGGADLWVLPVRMTGKSLKDQVYATDTIISTAINEGISVIFRPIMASGANLLFRLPGFIEVAQNDHLKISSGDDVFLLRDFREGNKRIELVKNDRLAVYTNAPEAFGEMIDQRVRWISKSVRIKDRLALFTAVFQLIFAIFFLTLVILTGYHSLECLILFVSGKVIFDTILLVPHFAKAGAIKALLFFPLYDLLLPLYTIVLVFLSIIYRPEWKGRRIVK